MKKFTPWLAGACFLAAILFTTGCHTSKRVSSSTAATHNHNPQFIDSIVVGGHNTSAITNNAITATNRHKKSKHKKHAETNPLIEKYASILSVPPQQLTNYNLYNFIDKWYGVDYQLGGSDENGIDCSAFAQRLYQDVFGINIVRTALEQFSTCRMTYNLDNLKEGDLVFFHINSSHITHVGVYLANNFFVHASTSKGVMISSLKESYWQRYFAGAGQIPKNNG